jgi:hypothetical protein
MRGRLFASLAGLGWVWVAYALGSSWYYSTAPGFYPVVGVVALSLERGLKFLSEAMTRR